ncbi:hypothetical protein DD238_008035 [Peronospora effusa]|uniref:CNNM transmembrane domain-containing protein n=1 Tax=Peronospora effusa TaxID=542832 RepID=A0A3M6V8K2_9STRA|nr:hypothetical protein DD238_008035 [Peronospora effusa]
MKPVHAIVFIAASQLQVVASNEKGFGRGDKSMELSGGDIALKVGALALLLALSAMFAGLGLGLMSLDLIGLEIVVAAGEDEHATEKERMNSDAAKKVLPLRRNGNLLLTTLLLGNVAVNVLTSIITSDLTNVIGSKVVPVVRVLIALFYIFAKPVSMALDATLGEDIGTVFTKTQIIDHHEKQQMIDKDESSIIRGAMTFGSKTARSIMTPADEVFMAPFSAVLDWVLVHSILASGFSRVLVHGASLNDIIGTIHVKDFIFVDPKIFGRSIRSVDPDCRLSTLLHAFKFGSARLVLVKQPQTTNVSHDMHTLLGIVTLEDVLEEILQTEILDERDISDRRSSDSERKQFLLRRFDEGRRLGLNDLCEAGDSSEDDLTVGLVHELLTT